MGGRDAPGEALRHPVMLASVAVLVLNDHWLKPRLGTGRHLGVVTGKLSDVAGLAFFPVLLVSALELVRWIRHGRSGGAWAFTARELGMAAVGTGLGFAAVKALPAAADAYATGLAALRWVAAALVAVLTAAPAPPLADINHVMDLTDVLCVPVVGVGYAVGRPARRTGGTTEGER